MVALKRSTMPLYHQLRELLGEKIESGEWESGYRLPGENDLALEFGVSRATVRQAMQLLENQGLVERVQGRGTYVGRPKVAHDLLSLWAMAPAHKSHIRNLHLRTVPASASVASRLSIEAGEEVYELKRVILMPDEPLMIITSWLPASLFPGFDAQHVATCPISHTVEHFYSLARFHQHKEVEVAILDEDEANLLEAHAGAPALLMTYLNRLADGRPFEYRRMMIRGDRFKYYADLDMPEPLL
jgi:GntR family transcriptional regulator